MKHPARKRAAGFTLLEVMIAMVIGTIALMGTLAIQQAILNASKNANDSAIALRFASQRLEELSSRPTDTQHTDGAYGLDPISGGTWSAIEYLDTQGSVLRETLTDQNRYTYRWQRQWKVTNTGPSLPYVISVVVTYVNDSGDPKSTRLDMERRKTW
jgi:prepilin-type N-terminal cleavage/methylation domain-containing protein